MKHQTFAKKNKSCYLWGEYLNNFQSPKVVMFVVAWPSVTTDHCAMIEEENKRSAPAVPSSKLQHVKRFVLEDECARCFGQIDCIVAVENDHK
ncbi:Autophagy-related protein [Trichinella pseudospiralis]